MKKLLLIGFTLVLVGMTSNLLLIYFHPNGPLQIFATIVMLSGFGVSNAASLYLINGKKPKKIF